MSFDYSDLATTATELLTEFGQTCTLKRTATPGAAPTEQTGVALELKLNEGDRAQLAGSFGSAPLQAHKYLIGPGVTPHLGERLTVGSDTSIVKIIDPIKPGATVIAWQVLAVTG